MSRDQFTENASGRIFEENSVLFLQQNTTMGMKTQVNRTKKRKRSQSGGSRSSKRSMSLAQRRGLQVGAVGTNAPELKNFDQSFSLTVSTSLFGWSALRLLNGIDQGTNKNQRIGNKWDMKSIQARFFIDFDGAVTAPAGLGPIRVVLIWDQAPNGGTALSTDVFISSSDINTPLNLDNSDRFVILLDRLYPQHNSGTSNGQLGTQSFIEDSFFKSFGPKGWRVHQNGAIGGAGSMNTGALYIAYCTTARAHSATVVNVRLNAYTRVRFTDP